MENKSGSVFSDSPSFSINTKKPPPKNWTERVVPSSARQVAAVSCDMRSVMDGTGLVTGVKVQINKVGKMKNLHICEAETIKCFSNKEKKWIY